MAAETASNQVTVTTSATSLAQTNATTRCALIRNRGSVAVYVGANGVTTSTGFQLDPGESLTSEFFATGGGLWAITASGTCRVDVLEVGW